MATKSERIQCKDIPDKPILEFLVKQQGVWATWFGDEFDHSVTHAMPKGIGTKLIMAKMKSLIKRGLVDGCCCGCRGDYVITEKGIEKLKI